MINTLKSSIKPPEAIVFIFRPQEVGEGKGGGGGCGSERQALIKMLIERESFFNIMSFDQN